MQGRHDSCHPTCYCMLPTGPMHAGNLGTEAMHWVQVFEKGNFAGVEAMKANPRLYDRVAPMGVNDIIMAVRYQHRPQEPLRVPITAFDGLLDATIRRGNMAAWQRYTSLEWRLVPVRGDDYFVSSHYIQV